MLIYGVRQAKNQEAKRELIMSDNFSDIDELYDVLEGLDDMEDQDNNSSEGFEESKKITRIYYSLREWQESAFLEHSKIILADTSYGHIQKITLESGKVVYLVPEAFYDCRAKEICVQIDEAKNVK